MLAFLDKSVKSRKKKWFEEELGGEESFENVEVELIDGNKEGVVWLLINLVHIAYKQSVTKTTVKFQLSALAGEPHRPA